MSIDQLLHLILSRIDFGGMTREDFYKLKDRILWPNFTVEDYIKTRLRYGEVRWHKGRIVPIK